MNKKQKTTLIVFFLYTMVYWGFYNWIMYGIITSPFEKALAALLYIAISLPVTEITYSNTNNDNQ